MSRRELSSFAALAELKAQLIALPAVTARIAEKVAPEFSRLAQQTFDAQQSPYGDAWGTGADGKQITEKKSGALRSKAISYEANGRKIRATVGAVKHARYQVNRGILPKAGLLPAAWEARLVEIANAELAEALNG